LGNKDIAIRSDLNGARPFKTGRKHLDMEARWYGKVFGARFGDHVRRIASGARRKRGRQVGRKDSAPPTGQVCPPITERRLAYQKLRLASRRRAPLG